MPASTISLSKLQAEAARCERLASGVSSPDLIACLLAWAAEYRRDAQSHHMGVEAAGRTKPLRGSGARTLYDAR